MLQTIHRFYNHRESPYKGLLLVESGYYRFSDTIKTICKQVLTTPEVDVKLGHQRKSLMGQFISIDSGSFSIQPEEGPCRGFLCDCETSNFTFPALVWTELSRGPDGWHHTGRPGLGWTAFFTRKPGCQPRCPAQPSTLHQPPARALTGTLLAAQALVEPVNMMWNNEAYQRYF